MGLPAINVLLFVLGPPAILGVLFGIVRWSVNSDADQARTVAHLGELQVRAAERERKGMSR